MDLRRIRRAATLEERQQPRQAGHMTGTSCPAFGAGGADRFQQLLFGAIPEQVGQPAENTVIMANRAVGIASRIGRWFRGWNGS